MAPSSSNEAASGTVGIALRSARGLLERRVLKPPGNLARSFKGAASQWTYHEAIWPEFLFCYYCSNTLLELELRKICILGTIVKLRGTYALSIDSNRRKSRIVWAKPILD